MKFILLAFLFGCQTLGQAPALMSNPPAEFKKVMPIKVNGLAGVGALAVPVADSYKIDMTFTAKPEILKISTCHKTLVYENPTITSVTIKMTDGLETGFCPIRVDALDLGGVNSSAVIEVENEKLPAVLFCDGKRTDTKGVSICQARVGLVQRILFDDPVDYEKIDPNCNDLKDAGRVPGHVYDLKPVKGDCVYIFYNRKTDSFHRLYSLGFTDTFFKTIGSKAQ